MTSKRTFQQDPEYEAIPAEIQEKRLKLIEDDVRKQTKKKIENIIKTNFEQEIANKDVEIDTIDDLLHEGRNMLDRLRACIITKYYATLGQEQASNQNAIPSIHPTVKKYLGKTPKNNECDPPDKEAIISNTSCDNSLNNFELNSIPSTSSINDDTLFINDIKSFDTNVYLSPPQIDNKCHAPRNKVKRKIIIGNISKFIPVWHRDENDQSTHKWMVYVRADKDNPNIESFVNKVRFLLHPSYKPNDIVELSEPPFHLIKRGWGEFPVRVQLHFNDLRNKPVDIIHHLKLDKTFTGLQTLGAETVAELHLFHSENVSQEILGLPHFLSSVSTPFEESNGKNITNLDSNQTIDTLNNSSKCQSDSSQDISNKTFDEQSKIKNTSPPKEILPKTSKEANNTCTNQIPSPSNIQMTLSQNGVANVAFNNVSLKNSNQKANSLPNGLSTAFVKCVDSEGRVLIVPQTSLLRIKSENNNTNQKLHIPINNLLQKNKSASSDSKTLTTNSVPSYILKVIPNQESGQNQLLLIPMPEKSQTLSNNLVSKSTTTNMKAEEISNKNVPIKIKSNLNVVKSTPYWQQQLNNICLDYHRTFVELLKRVANIFPLIKGDIDRNTFPFCASSLLEYQRWNIGKQRAAEWFRAGKIQMTILNLLSKKPSKYIKSEDIWSKRDIMVWLRKNGYVPISEKTALLPEPTWSGVELSSLTNAQDLLSNLKEDETNNLVKSDEEIDILDISDSKNNATNSKINHQTYHLAYRTESAAYVKETASQLGIHIKPLELEPSIYVPVVEEIILSACKQLASDLIGSALNEGYNRMGGKVCPQEITVSDVYSAIKNHIHFDFLLNKHLGIPKEEKTNT